MIYSIYPTADTWITSGSKESGELISEAEQNFGQDQIIEIKKEFIQGSFKYATRALINFAGDDLDVVSKSIQDGDIVNPIFHLRLYETEGISDLSTDYKLVAYPVSESWDEGIGKFGDAIKEGTSWEYRNQYPQDGLSESWTRMGYPNEDLGGSWHEEAQAVTSSVDITITSYADLSGDNLSLTTTLGTTTVLTEGPDWAANTSNNVTALFLGAGINDVAGISASIDGPVVSVYQTVAGANGNSTIGRSDNAGWALPVALTSGVSSLPASASFQKFSYESADVNMNISNMVEGWFSGSFNDTNYGLILKFSGSKETDNTQTGKLKFFSNQSHTIYPPKLEVKWDDHLPATGSNTGSLSPIDSTGATRNYVYVKGLRDRYKETEKVKFRVGARTAIINKTTSTTYNDVTSSFIPEGSGSYSILDSSTGDALIPFDDIYTQLSCDTKGTYFNQWLNTFQPNRVYKILIKVKYEDKQEIIYDDNFEFKIVR